MASSDTEPDVGMESQLEDVASSYDANTIQLDDIYRQIDYEQRIKATAEDMLAMFEERAKMAAEEGDAEGALASHHAISLGAVPPEVATSQGVEFTEDAADETSLSRFMPQELYLVGQPQLRQQVETAKQRIEVLQHQAELLQQLAKRMEEDGNRDLYYENVDPDAFSIDYYAASAPDEGDTMPLSPQYGSVISDFATITPDPTPTSPSPLQHLPSSDPSGRYPWTEGSLGLDASVEPSPTHSLPVLPSASMSHAEEREAAPLRPEPVVEQVLPIPPPMSDFDVSMHDTSPEYTECTELAQRLCSERMSPKDRMETLSKIVKVLRVLRERKEPLPVHQVLFGVRPYLNDRVTEIRAAALRAVRFAIVNATAIQMLRRLRIDIFIVQTLTRDQRFEWEREQAVKIVRVCMEVPNGPPCIPESILRALVAIAEQPDDVYRNLCLETICELGNLSESLVLTLLYMLDAPPARRLLRPSVDVEMAISCFTDGFSRGQTALERINNASITFKYMMRSWTGLLYVCADDFATVRSVVAGLSSPLDEIKLALLALVRDILELDNPVYAVSDPNDLRGQLLERFAFRNRTVRPHFNARADLVQHHLAAVLAVLVKAGLMERLCTLVEKDHATITPKASRLLADVLKLGRRILPPAYAMHIQSLPQLVDYAVLFEKETQRSMATSTLQLIDHLTEEETRRLVRPRKDLVDKLQQVTTDPSNLVTDDTSFRAVLHDTRVLTVKDGTKWDWDLIAELFTTTLRSAKYLDDALRGGHFMKRLLGFFHPASGFPQLPMTTDNMRYIRIGIDVLDTLLQYPDGQRFLKDSELLREIALYLSRMIPSQDAQEPVLTRAETNRTLTWAYIWLLMSVSRTKEGIRALERANVFDTIYCLGQISNREDVYREFLTSMVYTLDGFPRTILSKMLTSEATSARWLATVQLRTLVHERIPGFCDWGIRMLVDQLYDPDVSVCQLAVVALDEACEVPENLEMLVRLCPVLDHLGDLGRPIFFRFLSSQRGVQHILNIEQISREMDSWLEASRCQKNNIEYVAEVEMTLASAFGSHYMRTHTTDATVPAESGVRFERRCAMTRFRAEGIAPPHLYGSLVRTPIGCELFQRKEHLDILGGTVHDWRDMLITATGVLRLKAALWAIGNIGASESGFALLNEAIVQDIVAIAEGAEVYSVRGTCLYVLGLICKTQAGAELVEELGWLCSTTSYGRSLGICLPMDLRRFFMVPYWRHEQPTRKVSVSMYPSGPDTAAKEVLTAVSNLTNHILANAGSKALSRLKAERPEQFRNLRLYLEVLRMLEQSHFRLSARRFILDLFDIVFDAVTFEDLDEMAAEVESREMMATFSSPDGAPFAETGSLSSSQPHPLVGSPELRQVATPPGPGTSRYGSMAKQDTKQALQPVVVIKGFII
ncbi:Rapamycin-insensitive companion of mTOR, middle domain-containing protein [Thamnocephalis sphaerospora]|uniref:Rapamycin-insensitive companion of mTOR, middle domain-containing protein n=1 Tax=Thamnocephalis sphaerospora TaxID=78915 RepID=A0A4V1IVZ9_9FUNG|nr:Rapamycin-insensitive companion of mTOR, middle domain-containing protein [Thamnocephalis sphaerospora]|eukprot:RKP05819.1 Rapamycin-insensitive companion of mTOR, middle domain-containing protein [Thamnocephalis sphaerospora]